MIEFLLLLDGGLCGGDWGIGDVTYYFFYGLRRRRRFRKDREFV